MSQDGERLLLAGMLSRTVRFRLFVTGPIGQREMENLIRKMETDRDILADDDHPPPGTPEPSSTVTEGER